MCRQLWREPAEPAARCRRRVKGADLAGQQQPPGEPAREHRDAGDRDACDWSPPRRRRIAPAARSPMAGKLAERRTDADARQSRGGHPPHDGEPGARDPCSWRHTGAHHHAQRRTELTHHREEAENYGERTEQQARRPETQRGT